MYAIVSIAGQQFKVEKGKKVFVHRLPGEIGDEVSFDKVLLISNDNKVNVGTPYLNNAVVMAQITKHLRGDKVLVFKKKRRKGYQKLNGHRQYLTEILIDEISEAGPIKKEPKKKPDQALTETVHEPVVEKTVADAEKPETRKAETKASSKASGAKTEVKKAAKAEKPAVKKPAAAKKPAAVKPASKAKGKSGKKE
jgi:large subunit ribosomal protein L21